MLTVIRIEATFLKYAIVIIDAELFLLSAPAQLQDPDNTLSLTLNQFYVYLQRVADEFLTRLTRLSD